MDSILFLDFDGVIRLGIDGGWASASSAHFSQQRLDLLVKIIEPLKTRIVISSDHRDFGLAYCQKHLGSRLARMIHPDWETCQDAIRWLEIDLWLDAHPHIEKFCILDDRADIFTGAPPRIADRLVLCNNRHGLVESLAGRINFHLQA